MYNRVLKRPMFRKGGSTAQGSGIMSYVEPRQQPRVQAANGFPNFGVSQAPINPVTGMTAYEEMLSNRQVSTPTPRGSIEDQFTIGMDEYVPNIEYEKIPKEQMSKFRQNLPEFMQQRRKTTALDKKGIETLKNVPLYDETETEGGAIDVASLLEKEKPKEEKPKKEGEGEGKTAFDLKGTVKKEAEILTDLLKDEGYEKGELALLIGEALATKGGFNKKLDKARSLGAKIAQSRRGEKKDIIKTAYKYAKEKEIQQAKGDDFSRKVAGYVQSNLADPKNTKTAAELTREAYNKVFSGSDELVKSFSAAQLTALSKDKLPNARQDIAKYEKKIAENKPLTEKEKVRLEEARGVVKLAEKYAGVVGIQSYKTGGRVELAESFPGTAGEAESQQMGMEATNITESDQSVPLKPVQKLSYTDLRNRLPKEITNDIVQLMANSEEALQDFAYIKTQEDINAFNVKYGVNLMLPPQTL
jgi:hypothetical protein